MATRYNRVRPPTPKPIKITRLHVDILHTVYKHPWVTYRQIAFLMGKTYNGLRNDLHGLWANKYILRPWCQFPPGMLYDKKRRVHIIGDKGVRLLKSYLGLDLPRTNFDRHEEEGYKLVWSHETAVTECRINFMQSARDKGFDLVTGVDLEDQTIETSLGKIYPDETFILMDKSDVKKNALFFSETDMGSEQIEGNPNKNATLEAKLEKYLACHREKAHTAKYGLNNMRVLIATSSYERIINIINKLDLANKPAIFLFTTTDTIFERREKTSTPILDIEWTNNKGEKVKLIS